jgi:hypothetical protein
VRAPALLVVALAACAPTEPDGRSADSPAAPGVRTVESLAALAPRTSFDMEMATASVVPAGVSFHVDRPPVRRHGTVELTGYLENAGGGPTTVVLFPTGANGFFLDLAPGQGTPRPPGPGEPPRPPPVPPAPLIVDLPAHTRVRMVATLDPARYQLTAPPPLLLDWKFQFWNEPCPHGRVSVPAE